MEWTPKDIALLAADAALKKKAEDVKVLDMREVMVETSYFVISSAPTIAQVRAIAQEIEELLESNGVKNPENSNRRNNTWLLMDYGSVIVHVFLTADREYYSLEKLWADAKRIPVGL